MANMVIGSSSASTTSAHLEDCVFAVKKRMTTPPQVGLVLGSGLGAFADSLEDLVKIPYDELPHMAPPGVRGHDGNLCLGRVGDVPVICMQGRLHLYEGYPVETVVQGVRTMARLGVRGVILTNAAGGLEPSWSPGDLMAVTDHINLSGCSPLTGPNDETLGPRFPDMTAAYDPALRSALLEAARASGVAVREGVYAALRGPEYETPAEIRMLRALGAHAVGMSTVHEVIALRHMGVPVGALSCITNLAAGLSPHPLSHAEVEATARSRQGALVTLLTKWIASGTAAVSRPASTVPSRRGA